jgi:dTMP kinase
MSGRLITLEGGEGAGKSTVLGALAERIQEKGIRLVVTREPGGTSFGEAVRALVLDAAQRNVCAESELLLMFAARAQLVREVIAPALARGDWVLSDRYTDASYAYQGGGRGQPVERIAELERWVVGDIRPHLTLLLDLPVEQGMARAGQRAEPDRIEREQGDFFENVRGAYRARAASDPERFRVIDSSQDVASVRDAVCAVIDQFMADNGVVA